MNGVVFEGYLLKESKYLKIMRKRWIVLQCINDEKLISFKSRTDRLDTDIDPTEIIDLWAAKNIEITSDESTPSFQVVFAQNSTRKFVGKSDDEVREWVKHITNVMQIESKYSNDPEIKN